MNTADFDPFAGPELASTAPSTGPQREIWNAVQMGDDASCAFNESVSLSLSGPLDAAALAKAFEDLALRHEALRTTFTPDGMVACIATVPAVALPVTDLSGLSASERQARLTALLAREVETPFRLETGPLLRPQLVRLGPDEHWLTITAHHIVCDGWSMAVMLRDLGALYSARRRGVSASLPPAPRFSDYARQAETDARGPAAAEAERYWLSQFGDGELPVLELPTDAQRPPRKTYRSQREDYVLGPALVEQLKKSASQLQVSFFTLLLGAFQAHLHRLSGQQDLVVGIPAAGQAATGMKELVGHCVNTLPLRARIDPTQSFAAFVKGVRSTMLDGIEHQQFSFGDLLRKLPIARDPSRLPLVAVLFNVDQAVNGAALGFDGLTARFSSNPRHFENFDQFINAAESGGQVVLECQYNADLHHRESVRRQLAGYEELLGAIARNADQSLERLSVLPAQEREALLSFNDTVVAFPRHATVVTLLRAQAQRSPDATAVVFGHDSLTYAALHARAQQVAHALRARGVRRGMRVGLYLERSLDMVVGLLGILESGAAYVPLDPAFPKDRIEFMVLDAKMPVVVTDSTLAAELPATAARLLRLDADRPEIQGLPTTAPGAGEADALPEDPAYVIYTSGSTGKPKGVQVPHRAVVNFLQSTRKAPGFGDRDTLLAVTTLSFDIAVLELHLPLSVGAKIILASREIVTDGALLRETIEKHGVNVMQATPSTWRLLLGAGWKGSPGFKPICGGEALPKDLAEQLVAICGGLDNMYGPTETTVWSTMHHLRAPVTSISIGKPIDNTQVYVLDRLLQLQPIGVTGELHIGGDGVTLGYLHRPELTAEKFIDDPFTPGRKLYKTGDLARMRADGNLEYLGRNDSQVKVRGFRIELGEIETALSSHPAVAQAVAVVREDRPGDVRLVAYVTRKPGQLEPVPDSALRKHLKATLPEYMIPQHFVELPSLPLTPNGKINRKALPAPTGDTLRAAEDFVAPATDVERALAKIWQEVLSVGRVSVNDNFFSLGGHSLLVAKVSARIQRDLGLALPMRRLFEAPTIAALARLVAPGNDQPKAQQISRWDRPDPPPVSLMQQRLWFMEELEPGTTIYNLPSAFRIKGTLDEAALQRALAEIVRRHETMRTHLEWQGNAAVQVIADAVPVDLSPVDLRALPMPEREQELLRILQAAADTPFSLTETPLWRAFLVRLAETENVLFFMPHHAIWDGWSFDNFLRELETLYDAFAAGKPSPLAPLPIRYADFAAWHRDWLEGPELERQSAYWRKQLAGELPTLNLPVDRPRPKAMTYRGATEPFHFTREEIEALHRMGRESDSTLFMVLLAAFQALLHRYTGQEDLIVGTPIRGRSQPELEELIGYFVNTLVLRTSVEPSLSFADLLRRVRSVTLDGFSHQDMPFERLLKELNVERDMSRTPLFQAFFTFQDVRNRGSKFGDLPYGQIHVHAPVSPTDLSLWVKETNDGLVGGMDYATDLFERSTIVRFLAQLRLILAAVAKDPTLTIARLPILPQDEKQALLAFNPAPVPFPRDATVTSLLAAQATRSPDATAVVFGTESLTYAALHARAHRVAHALRELGVRRGMMVGLYLERSLDMVVGLLGILEAGAAYVPLDPAFPKDRIEFMVLDAKLPVIVTDAALADELPDSAAKLLRLDTDRPQIERFPGTSPAASDADAQPEDPAYVIYTSGSTGKPKGVQVPHRAVVNFLGSTRKAPGLGAGDTLLAVTTLSFDIAVMELHLPLSVGAKIILASREIATDGALLRETIEKHSVNVMQATPSTWRLLIGAGWQGGPGFKPICGGEALPKDLAEQLVARCGGLDNMYGPTETTVWSTLHHLTAPVTSISIGRAIDNTQVYILDRLLQLQPIGVAGELHIGGDGVTLGYLHRPELTAEKFIDDPFRPGRKLYKTGDLARMRVDGNLEYIGRNDSQVKVRGFRIELGEIEASLAAHRSVAQAVVLVREDRPGDVRLVAYVTRKHESTDTELRKHLRSRLPEYMIPQHFVELPALPLTPNGKINRKALPPPAVAEAVGASDHVEPRTETEKALARIWMEALGVQRVSAHDNFFNLGGHSLLCLQVIARVERELGKRLTPRIVLLNSLEQIAAQLTAAPAPQPVAAPAAKEERGTFAQRMLQKLVRGPR